MKKLLLFLLLSVSISTVKSQSMVVEIRWTMHPITYNGLLVLYPNNQGVFLVKFNLGWEKVYVSQDAILTNQYDLYGNCTSYINCYNPRTSSLSGYAADNFIVYPNGTMYTQDAQGAWSTLINAVVVPTQYWDIKFSEYNYRRPSRW